MLLCLRMVGKIIGAAVEGFWHFIEESVKALDKYVFLLRRLNQGVSADCVISQYLM